MSPPSPARRNNLNFIIAFIGLLGLSAVFVAVSASNNEAKDAPEPLKQPEPLKPPEPDNNKSAPSITDAQDLPILIEKKDRGELLRLIAANDHKQVAAFFNKHNLLDYPLIRFTQEDGELVKNNTNNNNNNNTNNNNNNTDNTINNSVHGLTPLAAALYYCSPETAQILAPVQLTFPWTADLGPRHSLIEIAARHCPALLTTIITQKDTHPLGTLLDNVTLIQAIQVLFDISTIHPKKSNPQDLETIFRWIEVFFNQKLAEQYSEIFGKKRAKLVPGVRDNRNDQIDSTKSLANFNKLIEAWIRSGRDTEPLIKFLQSRVLKNSLPMYSRAAVMLLRANKPADFNTLLNTLTNPKYQMRTVLNALPVFSPSQFTLLDPENQKRIASYITLIPVDMQYSLFESSFQSSLDQISDTAKVIQTDMKTSPLTSPFADAFSPSSVQKVLRKYRPSIYGTLFKRLPRLDTVALIHSNANLETVEIVWTGALDKPFPKNHILHKDMIQAFRKDDPEIIKTLLAVDKTVFDWDARRFEDLRISLKPFHFSPLKAAILLNKPKIINYLLTLNTTSNNTSKNKNNTSLNNLYKSTKNQLSAIEMAACYQPQLFLDTILPLLEDKCEKRYKAANILIDMFRDTKLNLCPTRAQNSSIILPALMTVDKNKKNTNANLNVNVTKCITSSKKDYVEEAFNLKFPDDLIKGLHATGLYTKNDHYLILAIRGGNLDLFHYFFDHLSRNTTKKVEQSLAASLATWIRYTDGKMTVANLELLEFLVTHPKIDINALERDSGSTALSLATQRGLIWIIKRLLLHPKLNPNIPDRNSHSTPLHHAINRFRNEIPTEDRSNEPFLVRIVRTLAADFDIVIPELIIKKLKENSKDLDSQIFKFNFDIPNIKNDFKAYLSKNFPSISFEDQLAKGFFELIFTTLKIETFAKAINGKNLIEAIPEIIEFIELVEFFVEDLATQMKAISSESIEETLEQFRLAFTIVRSVLEEILEAYNSVEEAIAANQADSDKSNLGLPHNILLTHPAIDTTIENSSSADALLLCKNRAVSLKDDSDGFDEMARTHVRIRNYDTLLDGNRTWRRIIVGGVSTLLVGAASAGIVRWML